MRRMAWVLAAAALLAAGCEALQRWAAPSFKAYGVHEGAAGMQPPQCFACHCEGKDGAPRAPESMFGKKECVSCHVRR